MHPVIEALQKTQAGIYEILQRLHNPDDFFERTFLEITQITYGDVEFSPLIFDKIDRALVEGCADESMYLLFIFYVITALWNKNEQRERIESLIAIGDSVSLENVCSIVHIYFLQAKALPFAIRGEFGKGLAMIKEATSLIDSKDIKSGRPILNYASMLASCGRLADLTDRERAIFDSVGLDGHEFSTLKIQLHNCIYIGDYEQGFQLVKKMSSSFEKKAGIFIELDFLRLMSGDFEPEDYQEGFMKLLILAFKKLAQGLIHEAVEIYKRLEDLSPTLRIPLLSDNFYYLPMHLALCSGKPFEARAFLRNKDTQNNDIYIEDFFLIRVLLLERQYQEARLVMRRLIQNAEYYGAFKRILFELQFAKELSATQFFLLMHDWDDLKGLSIPDVVQVPPKRQQGVDLLIGHSQRMQQIRQQIRRYAVLDEIILVLGETGTGKELVAKALHQESSRAKEPFLAINCGALTDTLLESELFGYETGAFTGALKQKKGIFEAAGKGTVFLDEFGDISAKLQASLLRVLESGEIRMLGGGENRRISCRIIVATNKNLEQAVKNKEFREDLYFRLNRFEVLLPPLRARKEDIGTLIEHFLEKYQRSDGVRKGVTTKLLEAIADYSWPGNIRELKNAIDRLRVLNPNKDIFDLEDLEVVKFQGEVPLSIKRANKDLEEQKENLLRREKKVFLTPSFTGADVQMPKSLNPRQRLVYMKELFLEHKILSRNQIMEIMQTHPITATKDLQSLCEEGFIIRKQPTKSPRSTYFELNQE